MLHHYTSFVLGYTLPSAMGIYALFSIYRSCNFGVVVFKASMLDWRGDWVNLSWYICIVLYIYISGKFGVAIFKASILNWLGGQSVIHTWYTITPFHLPIDHTYMLHHYTFPLPTDHRSMLHHYTPFIFGFTLPSVLSIYVLFSIYRSCKFGVVVFKESMLNCKGGLICHDKYALFSPSIYICGKFGVAEFKVCMLDWQGA